MWRALAFIMLGPSGSPICRSSEAGTTRGLYLHARASEDGKQALLGPLQPRVQPGHEEGVEGQMQGSGRSEPPKVGQVMSGRRFPLAALGVLGHELGMDMFTWRPSHKAASRSVFSFRGRSCRLGAPKSKGKQAGSIYSSYDSSQKAADTAHPQEQVFLPGFGIFWKEGFQKDFFEIYLSIYLSIHLSIYPSIHLSIYPIYLSIYLSMNLL